MKFFNELLYEMIHSSLIKSRKDYHAEPGRAGKEQKIPAPIAQIQPNQRFGNLRIGVDCGIKFESGRVNPDDSLRIPLFGILELSLSGRLLAKS